MITIYTDGASRGNPGPGGWSAIVMADQKVFELGDYEEHTTNNRMELTGAIKALEFITPNYLPPTPITLFTDSEYVMKGMTLWIAGWQKRGWRTAGKKPVLNQDLWQRLLLTSDGKDITWKYVAGHSGDSLNDRCDEIATALADGMALSLYNGSRDKYKHL